MKTTTALTIALTVVVGNAALLISACASDPQPGADLLVVGSTEPGRLLDGRVLAAIVAGDVVHDALPSGE